jgi:hypothetical protein
VRQGAGPPWILWAQWVGMWGGRLVQYAGGRHWWVGVVCRHWQTPSFGTVRGGGGVGAVLGAAASAGNVAVGAGALVGAAVGKVCVSPWV